MDTSERTTPPAASTVDNGAKAKERVLFPALSEGEHHEMIRKMIEYHEMVQIMAPISNLPPHEHLRKMLELIASGCAKVEWLTRTDVIGLEIAPPHIIPPAIKDKIRGVNMTIRMRIDATDQFPLKLVEVQGDIFKAPMNAILMHACNGRGFWGRGIADEFRVRFPEAHKIYFKFCKDCYDNPTSRETPLTQEEKDMGLSGDVRQIKRPEGQCLLIPPQPKDTARNNGYKRWIACLITKMSPGGPGLRSRTLANTKLALDDMKRQIHGIRDKYKIPLGKEVYSCRLNAGLFKVPWRYTKEVMEEAAAADMFTIVVRP